MRAARRRTCRRAHEVRPLADRRSCAAAGRLHAAGPADHGLFVAARGDRRHACAAAGAAPDRQRGQPADRHGRRHGRKPLRHRRVHQRRRRRQCARQGRGGRGGQRRHRVQLRQPARAGRGQGDPGRRAARKLFHRARRQGHDHLRDRAAGDPRRGAADPGNAAVVDRQRAGVPERRLCRDAGRQGRAGQSGARSRRGAARDRLRGAAVPAALRVRRRDAEAAEAVRPARCLPAGRSAAQPAGDGRHAGRTGQLPAHHPDFRRGLAAQHVEADDLTGQLQKMFSEQGAKGQELSGMVRLIPLKQSNSLVVITPQPAYLDEVRQLVTTIDTGAGDSSGLYVYDVHNVKASDLATDLNELFGNPSNAVQAPPGAVAPGFSPLEQSSPGSLGGPSEGFGNFTPETGNYPNGAGSGAEGGVGAGMVSGATQARRQQQQQQQGPTVFTTSEGVRIAAVNSNNQLLVRAKPGQWEKLLPVIQRLDQQPLQVQIETRVLEVTLTGQFQFGVQYYLGGLIGTQPGSPPNTNESYHRHQGAVGLGGVQYNPATDALFYSFAGNKLQVALKAMEQSGDVRVLSAPSSVVLNNQEATFKVGEKIPVVQTYFAPGYGVASGTSTGYNVGQVQYIDTGVLLDVVPRVNPGGLVYMDIQQVVSQPVSKDQYGNYT